MAGDARHRPAAARQAENADPGEALLQRQDATDEKLQQLSWKLDRICRWHEDLARRFDVRLERVREGAVERLDRALEQHRQWQQVHVWEAQDWESAALRSMRETLVGPPDAHAESSDHLLTGCVTANSAPLPIALLFPGQGSQYVMMLTLVQEIPAVQDMLARSRPILGYDVLELCMYGPEAKLLDVSRGQPVMFIAGLAGMEKLRRDREEAVTSCQAVAGFSVGEYTALCAAGVFSFEDGLKLVKVRGELLDELSSGQNQPQITVLGLDKPTLVLLCREATEAEGEGAVCQISNELFHTGFLVAGTEPSILALMDLIEKNTDAHQSRMVGCRGGFHTPLMKPAQDKMGRALDEVLPRMSPPRRTVYMNATGERVKPGTHPRKIVELLKKQLTSAVLWERSVRTMIKDGVLEFYEVGPMHQIKAVMKWIDRKAWEATSTVEV